MVELLLGALVLSALTIGFDSSDESSAEEVRADDAEEDVEAQEPFDQLEEELVDIPQSDRTGLDDVLSAGSDASDASDASKAEYTLNGTAKSDVLTGGSASEVLSGKSGDDFIDAASGDDLVDGGEGEDTINGGPGRDTIYGGEGDDLLYAVDDDHMDVVYGGGGNDRIIASADDHVSGGEGADTFVVGQGAHIADFVPGTDRIELLYDPSLDPSPTVVIEQSETETRLFLSGELFLTLNPTALSVADIHLLPIAPGYPWDDIETDIVS